MLEIKISNKKCNYAIKNRFSFRKKSQFYYLERFEKIQSIQAKSNIELARELNIILTDYKIEKAILSCGLYRQKRVTSDGIVITSKDQNLDDPENPNWRRILNLMFGKLTFPPSPNCPGILLVNVNLTRSYEVFRENLIDKPIKVRWDEFTHNLLCLEEVCRKIVQ